MTKKDPGGLQGTPPPISSARPQLLLLISQAFCPSSEKLTSTVCCLPRSLDIVPGYEGKAKDTGWERGSMASECVPEFFGTPSGELWLNAPPLERGGLSDLIQMHRTNGKEVTVASKLGPKGTFLGYPLQRLILSIWRD